MQGLPHAIHVTTADVTDLIVTLAMLHRPESGPRGVCNFLVDGGYSREKFADGIKKIPGSRVSVAKRSEVHNLGFAPKRWVVESCFGRLEKYSSLWKVCKKKLATGVQMIVLAFTGILLRRLLGS